MRFSLLSRPAGAVCAYDRVVRLRGVSGSRLAYDDLPAVFRRGAIFSGFAMVLTLMIPARTMLGLEKLITIRHLDNMCKIILATGSIVGLAYGTEFFIAWYGQVQEEKFAFTNRAFEPYWWA